MWIQSEDILKLELGLVIDNEKMYIEFFNKQFY